MRYYLALGIGQTGHWPNRALAKQGIGQTGHWPNRALAKQGIPHHAIEPLYNLSQLEIKNNIMCGKLPIIKVVCSHDFSLY
jgi:hypothetical protein